jgi:Nif-specific regulatory protein
MPSHLPPELRLCQAEKAAAEPASKFREEVQQLEKKRLQEALSKSDGNIHNAAKSINITYRIFYYKLKKYGIDYRKFLRKK